MNNTYLIRVVVQLLHLRLVDYKNNKTKINDENILKRE